MRKYLCCFFLLCCAWPLGAQTPRFASDVSVTRDGDRWTADFHFTGRSRTWMFLRSELVRAGARSWREQAWRVETPGVRLERHGHHDVLVATGGAVPARVRLSFTPIRIPHESGYDPAMIFTEGSVALYTENFVALPIPTVASVERLPRDTNGISFPIVTTRMVFRDASGPVLLGGRRLGEAVVRDSDDDGTYVLFGQLEPVVTDALAAVFDPRLPPWIRVSLSHSVPDMMARYAASLGPAPGSRPTIFVTWAGPTSGMASMGGSALPSLITMAYEGERLIAESPQARHYGLWFVAHESAHFWLGNVVSYEFSRDAWITEGGADLLAFRMVASIDSSYDWRTALDQSIADCASLSTRRGVASAERRDEQRAYYACGAVFGLVAEAASRRPFSDFVRRLVEANRADRTVTRAEWLAALDSVSRDPSLSRDIGVMLDRGSTNSGAAIASLFTRAGVRFTPGPNGVPRLQ